MVWCGLQLDGDIDDCACSVESLDFFNNEEVFPIVDELMLRNYFRYYKVTSVCHPRPAYCHTNKHPFSGLFSKTTWASWHQNCTNHSGFYWSKRQWGGSGISRTICKSFAHSVRQITTPAAHQSIFYRPDALPDSQPTVSKQ